jgi:hypothetical protein
MKMLTMIIVLIVAMGMRSTAVPDNDDLVTQGYRWVKIDGPYACPTREDLRDITRDPSDFNALHMVEALRAYYLIQGALVKIVQEDVPTEMEQIRIAGIIIDLWTYDKFLSKDPIEDAYGVIETPETSGLIPVAIPSEIGDVEGATEAPILSQPAAANGNVNLDF